MVCVGGRDGEPLDELFHDRLRLPVLVAQHGGIAADTLHKEGHVDLAVLLAEHHQVTVPVAKLNAPGDAIRPV